MAECGGFKLSQAGRHAIQKGIDDSRGGVWLELTDEQYEKLKQQ
jgi:hypothetical protein